jgi:hypothetical protein
MRRAIELPGRAFLTQQKARTHQVIKQSANKITIGWSESDSEPARHSSRNSMRRYSSVSVSNEIVTIKPHSATFP